MFAAALLHDQPDPAAERQPCPRCGTVHEDLRHGIRDTRALEQLRPKLVEIDDRIDDMTEDDYTRWLNALSFAEFLEFIVLDETCMGAIVAGQRPVQGSA